MDGIKKDGRIHYVRTLVFLLETTLVDENVRLSPLTIRDLKEYVEMLESQETGEGRFAHMRVGSEGCEEHTLSSGSRIKIVHGADMWCKQWDEDPKTEVELLNKEIAMIKHKNAKLLHYVRSVMSCGNWVRILNLVEKNPEGL